MSWFVLLRVRAHRLLLIAALLTVVLATSVLAALTAFTSAVGDAGLRRALEHQSAPRTVVDVRSSVDAEGWESADQGVRKRFRELFAGLPVGVESSVQSGRYALPDQDGQDGQDDSAGAEPDLTLLVTFERSRMELVDGDWPRAVRRKAEDRPVQAVVPESVAQRLDIERGDRLKLASRQDGQPPVHVELSGVYQLKDAGDPYWQLDPLEGRGERTLSFTTYGPLVVDDSVFTTGAVAPAEMGWQADADFSALSTGEVGPLRDRVDAAVSEFEAEGAGAAEASSELSELLGSLERSLLVTRSTLLIGALQLVLLAGLSLILVAQLLAAERTEETALLRARGGSRARIAGLSASEALLLVLPAAIVAPLVAGPLTGWLTGRGALAEAGVELTAQRSAAVWWTAVGTALLCALVVVAPAVRRPAAAAGRRATVLRGGADIALVVLAVIAYVQLARREGGVLSEDTGGALGVDPVLVAAPALALLAGTVLALRILPFVARLGERRAARGRSLVGPLAGWQLSRRPTRGAAPAMLLVLAVAMGVFSLGQGASWERSQRDQADFQVGADVLVSGATTPAFGQGGVYDDVDGITRAAPVARTRSPIREDTSATVLATDTRHADGLLRLREDLADEPFAALLGEPRAAPSGPEIPADARTWKLTARLEARDKRGEPVDSEESGALSVVLVDRHGVPYRFALGSVPADGRARDLSVPLAEEAGGDGGAPAGPLRIASFTVRSQVPGDRPEWHRLTLDTGAGAGAEPEAAEWSGRIATTAGQELIRKERRDGTPKVLEARSTAKSPLTVEYRTGVATVPNVRYGSAPRARTSLTVEAGPPGKSGKPDKDGPIAAVATDTFLEESGASVGDDVRLEIAGTGVTARVSGAVRALPTAPGEPGADGGAVLLDLATLDRALDAEGSRPLSVTDWWLATEPGTAGQVAKELRTRAGFENVQVRAETAERLRADPLGAGPRTALTAIAITAALLAATGFAASAAGAVRERTREFAVLRALGTPRRALARVIATEHGVLVAISLAVGTALGALLLRLVLPLIVLTSDAERPMPPLLIQLPLGQLALLLAAVTAVPLLAVAVIALRRDDPVSTLRGDGPRGEGAR